MPGFSVDAEGPKLKSSRLQIRYITNWAIARYSWRPVSGSSGYTTFAVTSCAGVWVSGFWFFCLHLPHAGTTGRATQGITRWSLADECLLWCPAVFQKIVVILGPSVNHGHGLHNGKEEKNIRFKKRSLKVTDNHLCPPHRPGQSNAVPVVISVGV